MAKRIRGYLPVVLMLTFIPFVLGACGTLEIGIETPGPTSPAATATATYEVPPQDLCKEYLELVVSSEDKSERAVATSYRCRNAWIDSTGKSPTSPPTLTVDRGATIALRLMVEEPPIEVDLRLYPGAGLAASFFRWPEELSDQVSPVDQLQPTPGTDLHYTVQAQSGEYTLVCRVTWKNNIDVFYAISFTLED